MVSDIAPSTVVDQGSNIAGWRACVPRHSGLLLMERTMLTTALVVLGALFAAVLGRAMLTPWPSADVPGRPQ